MDRKSDSSLSPEAMAQLRRLQETVRKLSAHGIDRTAIAEQIIDEMARRQGHKIGPYFDWSLATEAFKSRFGAALSAKPPGQSVVEFARNFVDSWPQGLPALSLDPETAGPLARPPFAHDGLWPARLGDRK